MIARLDNPFAMRQPVQSASKPASQRQPSRPTAPPEPALRFQSMFDPGLDDVPFKKKQEKPTGLSYFRRQAGASPTKPQADTWEPTVMHPVPRTEWPQEAVVQQPSNTSQLNPGLTWSELLNGDSTSLFDASTPVPSMQNNRPGLFDRLANALEDLIFEDVPDENVRPIALPRAQRNSQARPTFPSTPAPAVPIPRAPVSNKAERLAAFSRSPQTVAPAPSLFVSPSQPMLTYQIF